jgi:hypothetical protein
MSYPRRCFLAFGVPLSRLKLGIRRPISAAVLTFSKSLLCRAGLLDDHD